MAVPQKPAPPAPVPARSAAGWRLRLTRLTRLTRLSQLPGLPRRTVRLKLTLLYGALFLVCGVALLTVTYILVAHRFPVVTVAQGQTTVSGVTGDPARAVCVQSLTGSGAGSGAGADVGAPYPGTGILSCTSLLNQQRNAELRQLITDSGIALAFMTAASIGLGWLVAGRVLRPLRTIATTARRISASNLHQRLPLAGPGDELTELGKTFNGLLARLEGSFGAQRQFVANASHELRTPLARQRTLVEVALRDPEPTVGGMRGTLERVLVTGEQQERLIEALLTLARSQRGLDRRESLDLAAVAQEALPATAQEAAPAGEAEPACRGPRVHAALTAAPVLGDPKLTERLAANLVDNAIRHNVAGGWVEVTTGVRSGRGFLSVANTGPAIAPEQVEQLFQPFGRLEATRLSSDGLGLGLSIVTAIAAAHDADLRARPRPGGGLEVEVHFPHVPADTEQPLAEPVAVGEPGFA
jgi:signal transduction histidine kinase